MKQSYIVVAVIAPQMPVVLTRVENTLDAFQAIVGGNIERIGIGMLDANAWCNEEMLMRRPLEASRFNPFTGQWIFGTFFVAGERNTIDGPQFCSLSRAQLEPIFDLFGRIEGRELLDVVELVEVATR